MSQERKLGKSPAFQFYPKDYISDEVVMCMSNEERGVYMHMLCMDWLNNGIPSDKQTLCRMFGCSEQVLNTCLTKFQQNGNSDERLFNKRLLVEREKQSDNRAKKRLAGIASAQARKAKRVTGRTGVEQVLNRCCDSVPTKFNSTSTTASPSTDNIQKKRLTKNLRKQFEAFRVQYPGTKMGHDTELDAFRKKHANYLEIIPLLSDALQREKEHRYQCEMSGKFVPEWKHLKTWLSKSCWEAEYGNAETEVYDGE